MTTPAINRSAKRAVVIIESPFAATKEHTMQEHVDYARAAVRDSLQRGEAPFASHLIYTQPGVLDDSIAVERLLGISAGFAFRKYALCTAVYADLGYSNGMTEGTIHSLEIGVPVEIRSLPAWAGGKKR